MDCVYVREVIPKHNITATIPGTSPEKLSFIILSFRPYPVLMMPKLLRVSTTKYKITYIFQIRLIILTFFKIYNNFTVSMDLQNSLKMRRAQVTDLQGLFRLRSQNKKTTSSGCNPISYVFFHLIYQNCAKKI